MNLDTIGIATDTSGVVKGTRDLDNFGKSADKASRNADGLGKSVNASNSSFDRMGTLLKGAGLLAVATQLGRVSDSYTKYVAILKGATDSQEQFNIANQEVSRIAKTAQSEIGAIGTVYARLNMSLKEAGATASQVSGITETLALSLKVNGASAEETASTMLQLSQAFGKGTLDGDEFKAAMEAAPNVMRELAKSMGVPFGALKDLGAQGLITNEQMTKAFTNPVLLAKLREQSEGMRTLGGSLQEVGNEFVKFIGLLGEKTGAVRFFAQAISESSKVLGEFNDFLATGKLRIEAYLPAYDKYRKKMDEEAGKTVKKGAIWSPLPLITNELKQSDFPALFSKERVDQLKRTEELMANVTGQVKLHSQELAKQNKLQKDAGELLKLGAIGQSDYNKIIEDSNKKINGSTQSKTNNFKAINDSIIAMQKENALITQGKTLEDARTIARMQAQGATQSQIDKFMALTAVQSAYEEQQKSNKKATEDHDKAMQDMLKTADDMVASAQKEYDDAQRSLSVTTIGEAATSRLEIAKLQEAAASAEQGLAYARLNGLSQENIDFTETQISRLKELIKLRSGTASTNEAKERVETERKAIDEFNKATEKASEDFGKSLTDSIFRGFENGKSMAFNFRDTLVNAFKSMVLRPIVQFLVDSSGLAKVMATITGVASGNATASTGGGGSAGLLENIKSIFTQGNNSFASSISSFGKFISDFGSTGTSLLADGSTSLIGSVKDMASSVGSFMQLNSTSISTALGYAGAAYSGFKMLKDGNYVGAALTGIGAAIGGPIGASIGAMIGSLFGSAKSKKGSTGATGSYVDGVFTGAGKTGISGWNINLGGQDALKSSLEAYSKLMGATFKAFGLNSNIETSTSIMQKQKGKKSSAWGGFSALFDGFNVKVDTGNAGTAQNAMNVLLDKIFSQGVTQAISKSKLPEGVKALFDGLTDKTQVSKMLEAIGNLGNNQYALTNAYNLTADTAAKVALSTGLAGDALAEYVNALTSTALSSQKASLYILKQRESLSTSIGSMPESIKAFDALLKSIDTTTSDGQAKFADLFGLRSTFATFQTAWDGVTGNVNSAIYGLLSPSEQLAINNANLAKMFNELNMSVPNSLGELINLGKSIDYTTESGLDLALAFPTLVEAFKLTKDGVESLSESLSSNYFTTRADYLSAKAGDSPQQYIKTQNEINAELTKQLSEMSKTNLDLKAYLVTLSENGAKQQRTIEDWDVNGMPAVRSV